MGFYYISIFLLGIVYAVLMETIMQLAEPDPVFVVHEYITNDTGDQKLFRDEGNDFLYGDGVQGDLVEMSRENGENTWAA